MSWRTVIFGSLLLVALPIIIAGCSSSGGGGGSVTLVSISVEPKNPQLSKGAVQQFAATGIYSDGSSTIVTSQATWNSSDGSRATVSASGLATAATGTTGYTIISATMNGVSGGTVLEVLVFALPRTGQTTCYDTAGTIISCATGTGQDGALHIGTVPPDPRYTDNGDGTFTDNGTGLMWLKDANCAQTASYDPDTTGTGAVTWQHALDFVKGINDGTYESCAAGHHDWRLPNMNELLSLPTYSTAVPALQADIPMTNIAFWEYWSSTSADGNAAWCVSMYRGLPMTLAKPLATWKKWAWPVRGEATGDIRIPRTGQTACYDDAGGVIACAGTGQDGETQNGVAWPSTRFTDNADGTITDNLTGLMWLKDANCALTASYDPDAMGDGSVTWQHALDFAAGVNDGTYAACQAGHTDWRVPNVAEMTSLASPNKNYTLTWLSSVGFTNLQNGMHWSSTTDSAAPANAFVMYSSNGGWPVAPKSEKHFFWLVR